MTIAEILEALKCCTCEYPREAVLEAVAQRETITPELLRILDEDAGRLAEIAQDPDYMALNYAMYLLAQFREPRAYPLLVKLFSGESELVDKAVGEASTDGLDRMLASTCHGDTSLIERMIEDAHIYEYARSAALGALVVLVAQGAKSRDEVMAYFKELYRGKLERDYDFIWTSLVIHSCNLYPDEVIADIEQAYADDLVDQFCIRIADVKETLAQGKEQTLTKLKNDPLERYIEDTIDETEAWAYHPTSMPLVLPPPPPRTPKPIPVSTPARTAPKVGRNEPCPCGSGKKFKRCCGA